MFSAKIVNIYSDITQKHEYVVVQRLRKYEM